jgi:hypothetical protein
VFVLVKTVRRQDGKTVKTVNCRGKKFFALQPENRNNNQFVGAKNFSPGHTENRNKNQFINLSVSQLVNY